MFFVEHVKGFIFIEADKEQDVLEVINILRVCKLWDYYNVYDILIFVFPRHA